MSAAARLTALCQQYGLDVLYAFGSRGAEVSAFVRGSGALDTSSRSDLDVGVLPGPNQRLDVHDLVRLAGDLEDLFNVPRVDLVALPQASAFTQPCSFSQMVWHRASCSAAAAPSA